MICKNCKKTDLTIEKSGLAIESDECEYFVVCNHCGTCGENKETEALATESFVNMSDDEFKKRKGLIVPIDQLELAGKEVTLDNLEQLAREFIFKKRMEH